MSGTIQADLKATVSAVMAHQQKQEQQRERPLRNESNPEPAAVHCRSDRGLNDSYTIKHFILQDLT